MHKGKAGERTMWQNNCARKHKRQRRCIENYKWLNLGSTYVQDILFSFGDIGMRGARLFRSDKAGNICLKVKNSVCNEIYSVQVSGEQVNLSTGSN